ncbi:FAD/NAD(P)-binding domain-containing protein [Calocera viscosa TUFC12733]|uniref:FAD/NAD(P)-binding domain-containing protein n=1 Tax=Calocera viscosa (strain TUFC12733) TaxID=1330018 RepID=A0A167JD65_CALVF|nr:FAD/NAD(P)-binding domain-containing protein [Calocera viscosa TUFC12733]
MKVIIVGAGIAGPVLALLLQHKGFEPVIYEAATSIAPGGSVQLSPQTFKVLNIVGLAERAIATGQAQESLEFRSHPSGRTLMAVDIPAMIRKEAGWPMCHAMRSRYVEFLVGAVRERGMRVEFGKKVVRTEQDGEKVKVAFEDGTEDEGDLLVGCDGMNSDVRALVFSPGKTYYTGIILIGGISRRHPSSLPPSILQVFGDGAHFLSAPLSSTEVGFQCVFPEPRASADNWRTVPLTNTHGKAMLAALPQARWAGGPARIISEATSAFRHAACLMDPLQSWHKGRIVLVGDAARPAAPHLGQGSNQAAEDAYHLVRLLCQPGHLPLSSSELETALAEYTALRVPHAKEVVASSISEGRLRVLSGPEKCRKRDEALGRSLQEGRWREVVSRMKGPFEGDKSEI